ncbi:MAG: adenylosuccinate lyase [Bacteroidia bacterium]|nr:adenylosuccinate lyase [Bacteroidia bacterium]
MQLSVLTALSPLDGRYRSLAAPLAPFLSEYALIQRRVQVEIEYLIALFQTGLRPLHPLPEHVQARLREIYRDFTPDHASQIKEIERVTNHDVKAVEYYIKERVQALGISEVAPYLEFIHFGLTSQDINNTAIPMLLRDAIAEVYLPQLQAVTDHLADFARIWQHLPMLSRTHGQPASPTTLGKEIAVFAERLRRHLDELKSLPYPAKFGGATGNLNAHYIAYPDHDWQAFAEQFVNNTLGLSRSWPTTQIEHYDGLARIFDCLKRINATLIDLCQDMWLYISLEYFRQQVKAGEVGSSAMPHKVNPIDFENAEGNCGLAISMLEFLSRKLPVSRLQRDLTDSTLLRNLGPALGYGYIAQRSLAKGLGKLQVNEPRIAADLAANWAVLAEAVQTILRRESYPQPYEALKALTRGQAVTPDTLQAFVATLDISPAVKAELLALSPETYTGNAAFLTR